MGLHKLKHAESIIEHELEIFVNGTLVTAYLPNLKSPQKMSVLITQALISPYPGVAKPIK